MTPYDERYRKLLDLAESLGKHRMRIVRAAVRELRFTVKDSEAEVGVSIDRLKMFAEARPILEGRRPLGGEGSFVSLMLSYNGSSWLNTAITSLYMVGNRVNVKFSSPGNSHCAPTARRNTGLGDRPVDAPSSRAPPGAVVAHFLRVLEPLMGTNAAGDASQTDGWSVVLQLSRRDHH